MHVTLKDVWEVAGKSLNFNISGSMVVVFFKRDDLRPQEFSTIIRR
jgi:hypothetical protein